jgi:hypothetical protein
VKHDNRIIDSIALNFAGPSTFQGMADVSEKGTYEIIVYAFDPKTGNTGVDRKTVIVR